MSAAPTVIPVVFRGWALSPKHWKVLGLAFAYNVYVFTTVLILVVGAWALYKLFSPSRYSDSGEDTGDDDVTNKPDASRATSAGLQTGAASAAVLFALGAGLVGALATTAQYLISTIPILLFLAGGIVLTTVLAYYTDTIVSTLQPGNLTYVRPWFDVLINPLGTTVLLVFQTAYGLLVSFLYIIGSLLRTPFTLLLQCSLQFIGQIVFAGGNVIVNAIYAINYGIYQNPVLAEWPFQTMFHAMGQFFTILWVGPVECACSMFQYVVGGIGRAFQDLNFANALTNFVNGIWVFFMETIIRPILFLTRPSINRTYQLQSQTIDSAAIWIEVFTTFQFDIYVMGGNGTLVGMVNGTVALPTDDLKYLVFFLQSHWAEAVGHAFNAFIAFLFWEPLNLAFQADLIFMPNGNEIFTWNMLRNETIQALDDLATVINVAPQCVNPPPFPQPVPFGNLISLASAFVWLLQIISDVALGELYSLFAGQVPGFFLADYELKQAAPIGMYASSVSEFGTIFGCTFAYLDKPTGNAIDGILETLLFFLPNILVQILAFTRYVIQYPASVNVLNTINLTPLQNALNQVAAFAEIFYQFQPGANPTVCPVSITFFCNLGFGINSFLRFIVDLLILFLTTVINLLRIIIGGIPVNTQSSVLIPDFTPLLTDGYAAACRIGVVFATAIPIGIPCMNNPGTVNPVQGRAKFCATAEFPGLVESNVTSCLATTTCKVTNLLMVPIEIMTIAISYVTTFNFSNGNLIVEAVKQVLNILIFRVFSFLCPMAHFFDCVFSAMLGGSEVAVTSFFCLITGAAVYLFRTLSDIIVRLLVWFIQVLIFVFGGFTQGNAGSTLVKLFQEFLSIIAATLSQVILAIINIVLSIVFSIIVFMCRTVNFFTAGSLGTQCDDLEAALHATLGGDTNVFFAPNNINYKRSAESYFNTDKRSNAEERKPTFMETIGCTLNRMDAFGVSMLEHLYDTYPDTFGNYRWWRWYGKVNPVDEAEHLAQAKKRGNLLASESNATNPYDRILEEAFGNIPRDPAIRMRYLFDRVQWARSSSCYGLFNSLKDKHVDELTAVEAIYATDCLKSKAVAYGIKVTFAPLNWLPEDIFYNPVIRMLSMSVTLARFVTVTVQWASDRTVPPAMLFSPAYQARWKGLNLNTAFYTTDLLPLYPGENKSPQEYVRLVAKIQGMSLTDYLKRSFPDVYSSHPTATDPFLGPLESFYTFSGEMLLHVGSATYNMSMEALGYHNATGGGGSSYPSGESMPHYYGRDLYNATEIEMEFGPDAMIAYNLGRHTSDAFLSWATTFTQVWDYGKELMALWDARGETQNFKRSLDRLKAIPVVLADGKTAPRLWEQVRQRFASDIDDMYMDAPVFTRARGPYESRFIPRMTGSLLEMAAAWTGAQLKAPKPWCVAEMAEKHNMTWQDTAKKYGVLCSQPPYSGDGGDPQGGSGSEDKGTLGNGMAWLNRVLSPRNEQARKNRGMFGNLFASIKGQVWEAYTELVMDEPTAAGLVVHGDTDAFQEAEEEPWSPWRILPHMAERTKDRGLGFGVPWQELQPHFEAWKMDLQHQHREGALAAGVDAHSVSQAQCATGTNPLACRPPQHSQLQSMWNAVPHVISPRLRAIHQYALNASRERLSRERDRERLVDLMNWGSASAPKGRLFQPESAYFKNRFNAESLRVFSKFRIQHQTEPSTGVSEMEWTSQEQRVSDQDVRDGYQSVYVIRRNARTGEFMSGKHHVRERQPGSTKLFTTTTTTEAIDEQTYLNVIVRGLDANDPNVPVEAFIDFDDLLTLECTSNFTDLCEQCFILDRYVTTFINRGIYVFTYYTEDYPTFVANTVPYLEYSFNRSSTPSISGNGTNSPWIPALNEPVTTWFQMLPSEIANGISYTLWLEQIVGAQFPTGPVLDGPLYLQLLQYRAEKAIAIGAGTPFSIQPLFEIMGFFEFTLGWHIVPWLDTIMAVFSGGLGNGANWLVDHVIVCDYAANLNCTKKTYSFAAGALVAAFWEILVAFAAIGLQPYIGAMATMSILTGLVIAFPFFHAMITYNWSLRCALFPQCYFIDLWNLWLFSIYPRCFSLFGTFISSRDYNAFTCFDSTRVWDYVNCQELGFRTVFDSLAYFKLWLGGDLGITDWLLPIWELFFGPAVPSTDFAGWNTDPVLFRNMGGCSIVTVLPYAAGAALFSLVVGMAALAVISVLPAIFVTLPYVLAFALYFIFACALEIEQGWMSREVQKSRQMEARRTQSAEERRATVMERRRADVKLYGRKLIAYRSSSTTHLVRV